MKFSACCTTQSRNLGLLLLLLFLACADSLQPQQAGITSKETSLRGADATSTQSPVDLAAANTLQMEGKRPFHLAMSFEVFDFAGKSQEQGTIDYWWAGSQGFQLSISAPSLGTVHDARLDQVVDDKAFRTLYFANQLLNSERFGSALLTGITTQAGLVERSFGTVKLNCTPPRPTPPLDTACVDQQTGAVRVLEGPGYMLARNRTGNFAGTHVALEEDISWGHRLAIRGHISKLESFDPAKNSIALSKSQTPEEDGANASKPAVLQPGVMAGSRISGKTPEYPLQARQQRIQGTVLLAAEISKEGRISRLVPLASPDALLTGAAKDAVSKWVYKPYLLNGAPTTVSTTITVNFNMSLGAPSFNAH